MSEESEGRSRNDAATQVHPGTSRVAAEEGPELSDEEVQGAVNHLLAVVDDICGSQTRNAHKRYALEHLSSALRPQQLHEEARRVFVRRAMARGVVAAAVQLIELGVPDLACAASNFLGDFAFNSDAGARAVLEVFDRIAACFKHIFEDLTWQHLQLLDAAILLCVNVAAICPSGHPRLVPLVRPVCLQIISNPSVSDKLRGNTILLLANLSMTVGPELRSLHVADVLLDLVVENRRSGPGKSVAESVIIFLHGSETCREIDTLMSLSVVADYCVPLLQQTLVGGEFRGMYPHLLYSARLFQVLAQSKVYAETLVANPDVISLLLRVNHSQERALRVESDQEGRRLALEAMWSFARFRLWPRRIGNGSGGRSGGGAEDESCVATMAQRVVDDHTAEFLDRDLPLLLRDEHPGIRASAAGLWASLNAPFMRLQLLIGQRLAAQGLLPCVIWRTRILAFLFPFLEQNL